MWSRSRGRLEPVMPCRTSSCMDPAQDQGTDSAVWQLMVGGDPDALGLLFDRHADAVFSFCRQYYSEQDASDATSIVFLEVWRKRQSLRIDSETARPLLLGIAKNAARNLRRAARRYEQLLARIPHPDTAPDPSDVVEDVEWRAQAGAAVLQALARLSERDRQVIQLCVVSEMSHAEAAAVLHVPIGTVKSRLSRAKARLRSHVRELPDIFTTERST